MKTVVGFTFTESPLQRLITEGFLFRCNDTTNGYREFICPLSSHQGSGFSIEIREVLDENTYFQFQESKNFSPFESENAAIIDVVEHPNQVRYTECILREDMAEGDLKDYLKIRKQHSILALWLKCEDFELFKKIAKPDKYFLWQNRDAALIHLGQSCFDLLITAS